MRLYKKLKQIKQDIQNLFDDLKYIKNSSKSYDYNNYKDIQEEKIIIDSLLNCPVCGQVISYNSYFKVYLCDCGYEEE